MSAARLIGRLGEPAAGPLPLPGGREWTSRSEGALSLAWAGDWTSGSFEDVFCLVEGPLAGTDPAALARGFAGHGESALEKARGSFLLVLWSARDQSGLVAADPLGSRSVLLAEEGRELCFATELPDLETLLRGTPPADERSLALWLARRRLPAGATLLAGVGRLPGGHLQRLGRGRRVHRWWEPLYREPEQGSFEEAAEGLRAQMRIAVARCLEGSHAPGIMLSGGFDSGAVAGLAAAEAGPGALRAFSGAFPANPEMDESGWVRAVAEFLGLPLTSRAFSGGSALAGAERFIAATGLPPSSPNWFAWEPLLAAARSAGIDRLLDGEGGDELFGLSPLLLADLLKGGHPIAFARLVRQIPGMGAHPRPRWLARAVLTYGLRGALPRGPHTAARRMRRSRSSDLAWLSAEARRGVLDAEDPFAFKQLAGPRWWAAKVDELVAAPDAAGAGAELRRVAEANGVAFAHPWREPALIEHVLALPPHLSFHPELDRPLAREAMRGLLPEATRLRTAKPVFGSLLGASLTGPDRRRLEDTLARPPEPLASLLAPGAAERLADRDAGPGNDLDAWRVLVAGAWLSRENT